MSLLYLAALLGSLFCMGLVDHRWKLFVFRRPGVALAAVGCGFVLFLVWDVVAIALDMYTKGESPAMTGIDVAPHLPVEELVFITFLCYITGVLHALFERVLDALVPASREQARTRASARRADDAHDGVPGDAAPYGERDRTEGVR